MSDDFILDELNNVRAQRAGRSVVGTQDANADTAARANNLSRRLGIPADVIERNMTEIEQRDRAKRNARLVREAPAPVQDYFGNPRNAAAAKDDVEPLTNMAGRYPAIGKFSPARQPEAFGDIGIVRQTGRTVRETVTGIPSALASGLYSLGSQMESFIGATTDVLNAIDPKPAIAGFAGDVIAKYTGYNPRWDKSMEQTRRDLDAARVKRQAALKGEEEAWKPKSTSWIARDLLQGVSSVPATAAAMLTRDPKAASGVLGALVGAGEYDVARAQGLDIGSAIAYGARQGVVEGITERIPASKLLGDIAARSPFGKMLMGQLASEIPGEQVATFLQDLDEWVTLNPDKTVGEFVRERPSAAGQTLLATIGGVGTTVGGAKLATTVVDQVSKVAQRRERRDIRSAAEAVEAQAGAQILDGMMSDAEAAKLRTTDPEAFRQYVEAITGGTAIETVYIPGEAIRELMQDGYRDAPFWSDHADQIDEALALDGDVALPFDQFATFVAGTPEWQTLRDDVRFSPGGMSMAELASIEEAYRADGEVASGRLAEQMEQAALAAEPGAQVYAEMRDQFQNAGFRPDAADRYASIWAANREAWAERMGMTASEYHAANPVNIRRVLPEGLAKALPVDGLDLVINAMRAPDKAERKGPSLLDFISKRGGVEDRGGNIASMGGGEWHKGKVGKRKLLKDFEAAQGDMIGGATSDNSLERTIEAARDAGYDVTDEASLLTAIGNELRGTPSFANEAITESETQRIRDASDDLRRILIESNIDPDTATKKEIEAAIDAMRDVDPFEGRALEQLQANDLVVVHNIKARGVINADKIGGLPVPSLAIIRADHAFDNYGEITLIGDPSMADPKTPSNKVFGADAYSPRYPTVEYKIDDKAAQEVFRSMAEGAKATEERIDYQAIEKDGIDALGASPVAMAQFLIDNGVTPNVPRENGRTWRWETEKSLREQLAPMAEAYDAWIADKNHIISGERIFDGFTYTGNRRYLRHDLDTVVKVLKRGLRNGEGFNYGVGSIRSTITPQFRTLKQVKGARDKLVTSEEMDVLKNEASDELLALAEKLRPFYKYDSDSFGFLDQVSEALGDVARTKRLSALDQDFENLPDDVRRATWAYLEKLRDMPTEYFEAKPQRAVALNEFVGAIVPENVDPKVRAILEKNGLQVETYPKFEGKSDRSEAIGKFDRAFFQGGEQPRGRVSGGIISGMDGPAIIELFEKSDMSTVLHETAHVWLEELKRNAASPDAPADVVEDWQVVVDWFAANNVPMEGDVIPVEAHELFARGGERYFMEGKAPSTALQRAFDTFRGWLLNIYQVVANLRSPITPEIRRVFDRMLATRDALDDASERQQLQARFESAEQAGMTQEAFAAYRALADAARTEAFNALLFRTMAGIRKERTKEYQSQAASVRDDVTAAMNKRPDFRALHLLRTGRFLDDPTRDPVKVKISRDWLVENFGEDALGLMPKGVPPIYSDNGAHPDMAANLSGFRSGEEMVRALMGLEQAKRAMVEQGDKRSVREAAIKDEVDRIMFDRYGDPLSDGSIEEEALAAVANDKEAELIASENRALAKQARGQPTAYSVARQWAARKIAQGRVVDVASKAALHRYARAQAKATKAFEVALLEGNVDEAFRQSELRLLNNALISEAKKAADKVEVAVSRLSRTAKQRVRKSVDQEYFDRAQALLAKFEFMPRSQKLLDEMEAFASWAEKQAADGIDVAIPPRLESDGVHYTRMSVEELVGLDESVEQLLHLGRMKKTMLDNKERREFGEIVDEAVSAIEETPQRKKNNRMRPSWIDEQKAKVASYDAALLKMEQVFDWLDNGNPNGVFNRMVFQPLAEAQARAREMMTDYLGQVRDALRALPKDVVKKWEDKVDAPELLNRETGEAFELDRQTLISMAFNVGNEGNFDKLARGYGWNPETVMRVLQRELTAEEWRFVQSMWDMIDTLWPEIEALEKRINGVAPERVEARAFTVTVGDEVIDMRGGYFPVVYDPLKNIDTEAQQAANSDNLFSKAYRRATTPKGFTKERTEVARPILLSMSVLNRHLNEVIHDITHREPIIAANKILSDRRVIKAVDDSLGRAVRQQFRPWLQHIANEWAIDARGVQGWETIAKTLRTHSTMIGMGFRLSTIFAQVAGYAGVAEKVGTRWLADGMKAALARPVETFDFVMERSKEVAARMDTMERDINSNIRDLQGRTGVLAQTRRFAFYGIGYMDRVVVIPAWLGSYNKALSEGMTDDQAIHFADKVIRQTQGAGAAKDLAAIQRGSEWLRLASMFYSYASAFYNRQRNLGRDVKRAMTEKELSEFPGLLARAWWLFAVAPIMGALPGAILSGSGPDEDEDESWMGWALGAMAGNFFYGVPLARDVASSAVSGFDYGFTPASRMVTTLMDATGDLKALVDADEETDPSKRAVKTAVESVGYVARLPLGQFSNASQFIADWASGEADPDGVGDWLTGLQRGKLEE